jgi:hypothetical protein
LEDVVEAGVGAEATPVCDRGSRTGIKRGRERERWQMEGETKKRGGGGMEQRRLKEAGVGAAAAAEGGPGAGAGAIAEGGPEAEAEATAEAGAQAGAECEREQVLCVEGEGWVVIEVEVGVEGGSVRESQSGEMLGVPEGGAGKRVWTRRGGSIDLCLSLLRLPETNCICCTSVWGLKLLV